jgi:hypothetical protein
MGHTAMGSHSLLSPENMGTHGIWESKRTLERILNQKKMKHNMKNVCDAQNSP